MARVQERPSQIEAMRTGKIVSRSLMPRPAFITGWHPGSGVFQINWYPIFGTGPPVFLGKPRAIWSDWSERTGFGRQISLNGSKWIMKKKGDFVEVVYFVGVPDGI